MLLGGQGRDETRVRAHRGVGPAHAGYLGIAFLREVRAQWPDTVRLILSGDTDAEDIIAGINEAGIWQYLLKPWHPDQLLHKP